MSSINCCAPYKVIIFLQTLKKNFLIDINIVKIIDYLPCSFQITYMSGENSFWPDIN